MNKDTWLKKHIIHQQVLFAQNGDFCEALMVSQHQRACGGL